MKPVAAEEEIQSHSDNMRSKAFRAAFPHTIPVMMGYLCLGLGFGLLLESRGFGWGWALFTSFFMYSGSLQYVAVQLLSSPFNLINTVLMTLIVQARHIFYGIGMLERFKRCPKTKPYMIFALTDETFSLLCSAEPPTDVDYQSFAFFIAALNQCYWLVGSVLGAVLGSLFVFDTTGVEFSMTALFVVIFVDQWRDCKHHSPALIGLAGTALCLILFGSDSFLIPAMIVIVMALTIARRQIEAAIDSGTARAEAEAEGSERDSADCTRADSADCADEEVSS